MKPPERTKQLRETHLRNGTLRQLSIPLVLDLCDLAIGASVDVDNTLDDLLLADTFDHVASLEVHGDGVSRARHLVVQTLNFGEGGLKTVLQAIRFRTCFSSKEAVNHLPTEPHTSRDPWQ